MKKYPSYKGGGAVKGEPSKPSSVNIDRSKYSTILSQPMSGTGTNVVGSDTNAFNPSILKANGYNLVSGSGKDAVWEKGGNYHIYNEQPNATQNKYGLINIGNGSTPSATNYPATSKSTATAPYVDPNHKPLDFSNPNMVYDPNTGSYKNPTTGSTINPIVEQYANGGKIKPMAKYYKGYDAGGMVEKDPFNNSYNSAIANANQKNQDQINADNQATRNTQIKAGADTAGKALGAYGTGYYAANPGDNAGEQTRSATLGAVSNTGAVGGAIGGIAAIGDSIGKPIKAKSERTDTDGNLLDPTAAKRNAVIGSLFSPSKALAFRSQYKGGWSDISGNGYLNYLQNQAKGKINDQRQAAIDADNAARIATNNNNFSSALQARDDNQDYTNNNIYKSTNPKPLLEINNSRTASLYGGKSWWQRTFKDGGTIKGPGTGKSDSIKAKVKPGSFIVPAENADKAEELREKVLDKEPDTKADLNQKGGTEVKLSNGEHMFSPEEKSELENYGYDVDALAPDSDDKKDSFDKGGGVKTKAERDKIAAQEEAIHKANEAKNNQSKSLAINKSTLQRQDAASKRLIESDKNLKALEDDYNSYNKRVEYARSTTKDQGALKAFDDKTRIEKKRKLDAIDQATQAKESANNEYKQANFKSDSNNDTTTSNGTNGGLDYLGNTKTKSLGTKNTSVTDYTPDTSARPSNNTIAPKSTTGASKVAKTSLSQASTSPFSRDWATVNPGDNTIIPNATQTNKVPADTNNAKITTADPMANASAGQPAANPNVGVANGSGKKFDYSNLLGNLINYGIPAAQVGFGLSQLKKAGNRPIDSLSADYNNSIDQTRAGVQQAKDQSQYGFTGQQLTDINNQNNQLTNAGRYEARNFSGGSSGNALNMERSVINDSFGRNLATQVQDRNLQLQKQQDAFNRQQMLNGQIQDKQDRLRQYFGDNLNAWQQKTSNGAALAATGLSSAIDGYRANERLKNYDEIMKNSKVG